MWFGEATHVFRLEDQVLDWAHWDNKVTKGDHVDGIWLEAVAGCSILLETMYKIVKFWKKCQIPFFLSSQGSHERPNTAGITESGAQPTAAHHGTSIPACDWT